MMTRFGFLWLFLQIAIFGCRSKPANKAPKEQCEISTLYIWYKDKCQLKTAVAAEMDCDKKGSSYKFSNNQCVSSLNQLTPAQTCMAKKDGSYWYIDPDTKEGDCITPNQQTAQQKCQAQTGYKWIDGKCYSPEGLVCIDGGDAWYENRCVSKEEEACWLKVDGSAWINARCVSAKEATCIKNYDNKWVKSESNFLCVEKTFLDYCIDDNAPKEIKITVNALRAIPEVNNLPTHDGCIQAEIDLSRRVYINLTGKEILNLKPLSQFVGITELDLTNNHIQDITPLQKMTRLTRLTLNTNNLSDISAVSMLIALEVLNVNNNSIASLAPIKSLRKIQQVYANDNKLADISDILDPSAMAKGALQVLRSLELANNCDLKTINGLLNLPKLGYINVTQTKVTAQAVDELKHLGLNSKLVIDADETACH